MKPEITVENLSFSQSGEDRIVKSIFDILGVKHPSYLDIGAHHPTHFSNTALFYALGSRGVNIEPDADAIQLFYQERQEDVNIHAGVGDRNEEREFYVLNAKTLSTFSRKEADEFVKEHGFKIEEVRKIPMYTLGNILDACCHNIFPDFLTLDIEGFERQVIEAIPFERTKPTVICVETISYSEKGTGRKDEALIRYLTDKGYMLYADTYINSIFVVKDRWVRG